MKAQGLGIFICECGEKISTCLDLDFVQDQVHDLPGIRCATTLKYACSTEGLTTIQDTISEQGLERILVAGCTPRTVGPLFHEALEAVNFSADLFELVDIREGCAWVHRANSEAARFKAVDLIRMGAIRVGSRTIRPNYSVDIEPSALVIGGGLAGLTAALNLADEGVSVRVIEREAKLGGMLQIVHTLFPERQSATEIIDEKVAAVTQHPKIEVLLEEQVKEISGTVGRYSVTVNGRTNRRNGDTSFEVGAIIVATGARELKPFGQYRYDGKRVVTQLEFENELREAVHQPGGLPDSIVMILCAGQRDTSISYCSGVCCMGALKQAMEVKVSKPSASVTILFRDLYLLGDEIYERELIAARQNGVRFMRYDLVSPLEIDDETVTVEDELSGITHQLPYDRIVLAAPLVPQEDAGVVAHILKLPQDVHGFFPEIRHRLCPGEHPDRGIFVCGAAHYPVDWGEAEYQGSSAAFKALSHLKKAKVTHSAHVVTVDKQLCTGCGNCISACSFNAISMCKTDGVLGLAEIDTMLCAGCGNCVVTCPVKAIHPETNSDCQIFYQIDEALRTESQDRLPRILVFGCQWSGGAAAEVAGAKELALPEEIRPIRVGCAARFDPLHILWALHKGAGGVFLGACPPGRCHYGEGNLLAQIRISRLRAQLKEIGFDHRRLQFKWITPDDPYAFANAIWDFANLIRLLSPKTDRTL
jgi:heterodisulfide reductase subunit A